VSPDVVVVGAGVFGAWIAWHMQASGRRTLILDQYGVATSRASSGGETRLTRAGYGRDVIYSRAARTSLESWRRLERATGTRLFEPTGVLTLATTGDAQTEATLTTLLSEGVPAERLTREEILARFEPFALPENVWGVFEPEAGVLHARRGVEAAVADARRLGAEIVHDVVAPLEGGPSPLDAITTADGRRIRAGIFILAAGPWLPVILPGVMSSRLFVTRQAVFFFGAPRGDRRYAATSLPAWIDFQGGVYGHGDLGRGVKIAIDRHGPPIDPDGADRSVDAAAVENVRRELVERLPGLDRAPLLETRVCQYENSASGDFVIDRHPEWENVWIAGGGSGHGFKHGPFVGDYVRQLIDGRATIEPRFALATKGTQQLRAVY
jgi:sarcosine oxidase